MFDIIGPYEKSFEKLQVWSLEFLNWQIWSLRSKNGKYAIMVLVLMFNCRFGPYVKFGKVTNIAPQKSEITNWSLYL